MAHNFNALKTLTQTQQTHSYTIKIIVACQHLKEASHLPVPTYDHLFASEHDICGSLQAREV